MIGNLGGLEVGTYDLVDAVAFVGPDPSTLPLSLPAGVTASLLLAGPGDLDLVVTNNGGDLSL